MTKMTSIVIPPVIAIVVILLMTIAKTIVKGDVINYDTKTNGIPDWLKRVDGTFCMNDKSPATIKLQKGWQHLKDMGLHPPLILNPWPNLCSTPEEQGNDYLLHVNDPSYFDKVIPPSQNYTAPPPPPPRYNITLCNQLKDQQSTYVDNNQTAYDELEIQMIKLKCFDLTPKDYANRLIWEHPPVPDLYLNKT